MKDKTDKKALRSQLTHKRLLLPESYTREAALQCAQHLLALITENTPIIAGYCATRGELDLFPAMTRLFARGHHICLPIVTAPQSPLLFRHWQPGEALEKGIYNIAVPSNAAPVLVPDIVIVPLVGFDSQGHRLGYGAGFYDRTLKELRQKKSVYCVGAGFSQQEITELPADTHDEKLDAMVTEQGIVRF